MTAPAKFTNIGAQLLSAPSHESVTATAGAGGDGSEAVGQIIDLVSYGYPRSAKLVIGYLTTLTADKTLSVACDVDHGDESNLSDAAVLDAGFTATVIETGALTAHYGTIELDVDLSGAKRYIRAQFTPDLSHTSGDTVAMSAHWVFGGFPKEPVSAGL